METRPRPLVDPFVPAQNPANSSNGLLATATRASFRFFVTGQPIVGKPKDNATWLHDATRDLTGRPVERLSRARWRRVGRRWVLVGIPWLLMDLQGAKSAFELAAPLGQRFGVDIQVPGPLDFPWSDIVIAYYGGLLTVGGHVAVRNIQRWAPIREARRDMLYPAGRVLAKLTNQRFSRRFAKTSIQLPPGYGIEEPDGTEPESIRVYLPDVPIDDSLKKKVVSQVGARLGVPNASAKWHEAERRMYVELTPASMPPARVLMSDILEAMESAPIGEPVIGMANGGRIVHLDFYGDSPHSLGSAGSGAGKSTLYRLIAMQRIRNGAAAIILDVKKWSHLRWAGRLPQHLCMVENDIPKIHDVLVRVNGELMHRKSYGLDEEEELSKLRTIDIFIEEANSLIPMLNEYWRMEVVKMKLAARNKIKEAKLAEDDFALMDAEEALAEAMGMPKVSPAIQAIRYGVNLGREFGIHWHFIGQSLSASAMGGRDTRESFQTRLLARWTMKTWKMLADSAPFQVCPQSTPGIWAHVVRDRVDIVRVPFIPDDKAIEFIMSAPTSNVVRRIFDTDPVSAYTVHALEECATMPKTVTLRDAVGILNGPTLKALRHYADRMESTGFPAPIEQPAKGVAKRYRTTEIVQWWEQRKELEAGR